jgi:LuxR family maltose regulon positive regulatory protein
MLQAMLRDAELGARAGSVIEIRVVLALALARAGRGADALAELHDAVASAESEGHIRVFADEGPAMARLLTALSRREPRGIHLRRLLAATTAVPAAASPPQAHAILAAPLSDRELDVLRMLGTDLGGADIARSLSISLNTMRTHTKSIYAKLGVTSRRSAVSRAIELGLLRR